MNRSRKLLPMFLTGLLVFANTACACASAVESVSDNDPHVHHQMPDGEAGVESLLCPHQECDACETLSIAVSPERDASLASFARLGLDDDTVWDETNVVDIHRPLSLLTRAGPPTQTAYRRAETPVRRADLLLE